MKDSVSGWSAAAVVASVITMILLVAGKCGSAIALHYERQKAIEAGVGRWVVDHATGVVEFQYGPAK